MEPALALLPQPLRERFQAKRLLGRGGMGAVFEGVAPGTGRPCAVKIVHGNPGSSAGTRLIQEAQLLSRVRHPNLIEVYDVGEEGGMPWLAMELVEGRDLDDIHSRTPLSLDELEQVARDVTDVLEMLHGQGILHRDIKPQNLMRDSSGRTIVMDLGLARDVEATRQTATGALVGTLLYLPPEALTEDEQGPGWDWYALGMSLYVLLSGEKPYTSEEIFAMAARGRWSPPPPLPPAIRSTPLGRTCEALLHPDPTLRLADAARVRAALDGQGSEEVLRRPSVSMAIASPSTPAGRGRALATGLTLFALGVGLGAWWLRPARDLPLPAADPTSAPESVVPTARTPIGRLAEALAPGGGEAPVLTLEALIRGVDRIRAGKVLERMDEVEDLAIQDFLTFRYLETEGDHESLQDLFGGLVIPGDLENYFEARLAAEAVGYRLVVAGPYAPEATPEDHAHLKRDIYELDRALAARNEPWAAWARVELWDILSRRVQVRPRTNLPALQVARELSDELRPTQARVRGFPGVAALQASTRILVRLGELERARALLDAFEPSLLEPLESDLVVQYWRDELRFEFKGHELPAGGGLFSAARVFKPSFEVDWLPVLDGRRGLSARGALATPSVVAAPRGGAEVAVEEVGEPVQALATARRRALVTGGPVRAEAGWRLRTLTPENLATDRELRTHLTRLPELLEALVPTLEAAGEHELLLQLYREADRRRRNRAGHLWENRAHYAGPAAASVRRRVDLELRFGDLGKGMDRARTRLDHFRQLNPPYTLDEIREIARLWQLLDHRINRNGYCPEFRDEALRVGLHHVEALVRLRPGRQATTQTRDAWAEGAADALSEFAHVYARDLRAVDHAGRLSINASMMAAMQRLGPEAVARWTQQELTLRGERTRRTLSGSHGCPEGWVEANQSPPEVVFAPREGGVRARFQKVLDQL